MEKSKTGSDSVNIKVINFNSNTITQPIVPSQSLQQQKNGVWQLFSSLARQF